MLLCVPAAGRTFTDHGSGSFKAPYKAMQEAGKPGKVAVFASGQRLAVLAVALVWDNKAFNESQITA